MSEFHLDAPEFKNTAEQRRVAHGWVTHLADELLQRAETEGYVEFVVDPSAGLAAEMLDKMTLGDLYTPPGGRLGQVLPAEWDGEDKMGLIYALSFVVPPQPDRVYMLSSVEEYSGHEEAFRYIALGLEYKHRNATFRQLVGVAAYPDGGLNAMKFSYGESAGGATMFKDSDSRPISYSDTQTFVDCTRKMFVPG